jgi:hypothetical protein
MSWQAVMELLEEAGGDMAIIEEDKMERALARIEPGLTGAGPADVQKMIAERLYKRLCPAGQKRWEFG